MTVLLVGGAGDGGRIELPDGSTDYELVVPLGLSVQYDPGTNELKPATYQVQHYHLYLIHPKTQTVVFAHSLMTSVQVMEQLIAGYVSKANQTAFYTRT